MNWADWIFWHNQTFHICVFFWIESDRLDSVLKGKFGTCHFLQQQCQVDSKDGGVFLKAAVCLNQTLLLFSCWTVGLLDVCCRFEYLKISMIWCVGSPVIYVFICFLLSWSLVFEASSSWFLIDVDLLLMWILPQCFISSCNHSDSDKTGISRIHLIWSCGLNTTSLLFEE